LRIGKIEQALEYFTKALDTDEGFWAAHRNKAVSASYRKIAGGDYEVTIDVTSKKVHADEQGAETEAELRDQIDIGVLDRHGEYLFLEKRLVDSAESQFVVTVSSMPAKAGIDPLNKLIDRMPNDNVVKVKAAPDES
jgi:ABC-2 type transport system permease protein